MATGKKSFAAPMAGCLVLCTPLPQAGCGEAPLPLTNIAKTEIDLATDLTIKTLDEHLLRVTTGLYRLNPEEPAKVAQMTLEDTERHQGTSANADDR